MPLLWQGLYLSGYRARINKLIVNYVENPTPHLLLKNVFDPEELEMVHIELEFLYPLLKKGLEDTGYTKGSTTKTTDEIRKQNKGIFLDQVYVQPNHSFIWNVFQKKIYTPDITYAWPHTWQKKLCTHLSWSHYLVSYYEDTDYYLEHTDISIFSTLIWVWKEPIQFEGGDLFFSDKSHTIKVENNTGIIFFGTEPHGITAVQEKDCLSKTFGRWCIGSFSGILPNAVVGGPK